MSILSKSRLLAFHQCPKRLWLSIHKPELLADAAPDRHAQTGTSVGAVARGLYPDGTLIATDRIADALSETQAAMSSKKPVFEAAFMASDVLVRTDLLLPVRGGHQLVEVKSGASVKEHYLTDVAIQAWTAKAAGASIKSVHIAHINKRFVYAGAGDYEGLFTHVAVSKNIENIEAGIPDLIRAAKKAIKGKEPRISVGEHCSSPHDCPYRNYCEPPTPDTHYPISILPHGGKLVQELCDAGYEDLRDVPEVLLSKPKHLRVWRACKSGKPELDAAGGEKLRRLGYPRYYMDFESLAPAVPVWANTKPFQQIVFQWSCHIQQRDGSLTHREYLSRTSADPRRDFIETLLKTLGKTGPIFVYNASFEKSCLRGLAGAFPNLAGRIERVVDRIVDLLPIARENYYHPDMMGSWSIKAVLPAIAPDLSYDDLDVADGGMAQDAFAAILDPAIAPDLREQLIESLLAYCKQDTYAMVALEGVLSSYTTP
jgi:hypothetical protein